MELQRINKNKGGYFGETIDVQKLYTGILRASHENGWSKDVYLTKEGFDFLAFTRKVNEGAPNIYVSAGIHGDEPAAPLAALRLMEVLDTRFNIWFCPCLNPLGLALHTRENENGIDLNRDYKTCRTEEVRAHIAWMENQPRFDLSIALHEDWEADGFYVYSGREEHPEMVIEAVKKIFPIDDRSIIEGLSAKGGILLPNFNGAEVEQWPEAFYLRERDKSLHYTFETSSDYILEARVEALCVAVQEALKGLEIGK